MSGLGNGEYPPRIHETDGGVTILRKAAGRARLLSASFRPASSWQVSTCDSKKALSGSYTGTRRLNGRTVRSSYTVGTLLVHADTLLLVLEGSVRITALDYEGGNFIDDLEKGDLWYFPSGVPHSLQGLSPNGSEFLLIFDDGHFSEESTFILTDWFGMFSCVSVLFDLRRSFFSGLCAKDINYYQPIRRDR